MEEPFQRNNARGNVEARNAGGQKEMAIESWFKLNPYKMLLMPAIECGCTDEITVVVSCMEKNQCKHSDSDVNEAPTTQTMFMANLSSEDPIYDEAGPSYDSNTPFEVQDHDTFVDQMDDNIILYDQYVEDNEEHVVQSNVSSVRNDALMSILDEMHEQGVQSRKFDNKKSTSITESPDFNSFFKIKNLEHQIQEKDNVIRDLKVLVSNVNDRSCEPYNANDVTDLLEQNERLRAEIEKVKQHYKEMFESIKITRTSTNEQTSSLLTQIEDLKAQLEGNLKVATRSSVKTKVLAPGMYAIDVKPIPHPLKNNRSAHLNYINHLKESVETVREIVEEARVVKPLDNALNYACQYTKLSQELLEYVIGTCPKSFNERDNKAPSTPVTRKKQVTLNDKPGTSSSNTQKHEVHQKVQQTNVPVIHSTGVSSSTRASGSKPRSNTKHNRILPAKSVNNKKVEDHPRTNKSVWTKVNRVDSSISSKRVVINSNSESVCKTCNKCLNSANHEMCVVNILSSVNATPTVKIVLNKGKQIWKPKGKLSNNNIDIPRAASMNIELRTHQFRPEPIMMTPWTTQFRAQSSSYYTLQHISFQPTDKDLEILFQPMFDEYFDQSTDSEPSPLRNCAYSSPFPQGVAADQLSLSKTPSITQATFIPSVNPVAGEH
ncbi:hypothetical protein Tco_0939250 [Tanacetum coccineum]|uniref:Integrase, catalytic region, zinc finger, CCHC-type, peptidase aspartic, catalytic n=1 Tax=Tanacetum coccineum TaxID=301880 RepID=A0ABQ5DK39_9ASTR